MCVHSHASVWCVVRRFLSSLAQEEETYGFHPWALANGIECGGGSGGDKAWAGEGENEEEGWSSDDDEEEYEFEDGDDDSEVK